jgi:uncharacterized protein YbjT (DUF2867 family)
MKRVLVTGATGYIGGLLVRCLKSDPELDLRLLVRSSKKLEPEILEKVEVIEGSTFDRESLKRALTGIEYAYYLIHSMQAGKDYRRLDNMSAENFREACIEAGVKRIIYLGGLGVKETASQHLLSRIETGEILSEKPEQIQTIWLRAAVIIGSGSASFEIIRHLVRKLPILITPRWVHTRTQPVGVQNVMDYLEGSLDLVFKGNVKVDIGTDPMSFKEMLKDAARVMGLRRYLIPVPFFSPGLSSYWLILMTPVDFHIARELVEGLKSETLIQNNNAGRLFPDIEPMTYADAIAQALKE